MIFDNTSSVLSYLQDCGWKIKKSAFYKHLKDVKLKPGPDGKYQSKDVDRYARIFLKRRDGNKRIGASTQKIISMQERRLNAETRKLESQARQCELKEREAAGELMSRVQFEQELCGQVVILKSNINNFILLKTPELVRICAGDTSKIDETRNYFQEAFDDWMDEFARVIKWEVTYKPDPSNPGGILATVEGVGLRVFDEDEDY